MTTLGLGGSTLGPEVSPCTAATQSVVRASFAECPSDESDERAVQNVPGSQLKTTLSPIFCLAPLHRYPAVRGRRWLR